LLQAVSATFDPVYPEVSDEDTFDDWEDELELQLSIEELMTAAQASGIDNPGYFRNENYQSQTAVQKL